MMPSHFSDDDFREAFEKEQEDWNTLHVLGQIFVPIWICEALALATAFMLMSVGGMAP